MAKSIIVYCKQCNKEFLAKPSRVKAGRGIYCSRECYSIHQKRNRIEVVCSICNKPFSMEYTRGTERVEGSISGKIFCSRECWYQYNKGSNVYNYNSYTDESYRIRHSRNYIDWRNSIFIRDNYTCQACEKRGTKLNAHHIKSFHNNEDIRMEVDNGITLCNKCHTNFHSEW